MTFVVQVLPVAKKKCIVLFDQFQKIECFGFIIPKESFRARNMESGNLSFRMICIKPRISLLSPVDFDFYEIFKKIY